ncbi:SH3 domain-containing protein [Crocosphaera sp. XPORK-15E]|uniref:SH3 domain-containing protein n=1 Tax=Crocosphaera sp. XPORK-15E TaxID=3110247 RepID=UPI002B2164F1|nr:SH3 domain-containing protein [Crocosphaera sp. XPORK-15E]MEA5534046.1 SH3 domain-containing protein [Crocosphaera sp. XPORK-15E]
MNRLSGVFQFILGFFLGVALLVGGTASLAYVAFYRMSTNPEKPTFAEEKPPEKTEAKPVAKTETKPVAKMETPAEKPQEVAAKEPEVEVVEQEVKEDVKEEKLPTGAYRAKVTWSDGLSLRSEPGQEAERVGGVGYNSELIILKTSADGNWQQVRLAGSQEEGWIKAGNIEKVEEETTETGQ